MDPQTEYALERWNQMMNAQAGVLVNPQTSAYRGMVDSLKLQNPGMMSPDTDMLMRMMMKESTMNPYAVSVASEPARGLMQMKPSTTTDLWRKGLVPEDMNLYNPEDNIRVGMTYLDYLKRRYGGSWQKILQMYNVGPAGYMKGKRSPEYAGEILRKGG
jgi:soluble lytic murein transglycosylase-like protein